jgi:cobalt-zinc-cadmium efflux system protein
MSPSEQHPPREAEQLDEHAHGHEHRRGHSHDHGHHHAQPGAAASARRAFAVGIALNLSFVVVEVGFGFWSHSLALLADASHNFGDVIGLILGWAAMVLAARRPSAAFTYGLRGSTILAALANSMILLVVTGSIVWASIDRLRLLEPVSTPVMIWVAAVGVAINTGSALMFLSAGRRDLNVRGAFVHMAADAAVSLAVIVSGIVIGVTGWLWLDPVASLVIAMVILAGTWDLLRQSLRLAVQAVPAGVDSRAVHGFLVAQSGVREVHDLHIWAMSTTENAMTGHLVMPAGHPGDGFLEQIADELDARFGLCHVTLQVETGDSKTCRLAAEHVV